MTVLTTDVAPEPDERPVEEVRCSETGVPLPTIPSWYATVNVNFISSNVKKNTYVAGMPGSETDAPRAAVDTENEVDTDDEVEIDDIDIEDDEDSESETEE